MFTTVLSLGFSHENFTRFWATCQKNTLKPWQKGSKFADGIFKFIFEDKKLLCLSKFHWCLFRRGSVNIRPVLNHIFHIKYHCSRWHIPVLYQQSICDHNQFDAYLYATNMQCILDWTKLIALQNEPKWNSFLRKEKGPGLRSMMNIYRLN